ncbi:unnamed protein product [Ceratitis capitata]|uniref:(Mediterranean fruit fly) hypothetical protein n=1 Tax=Ceratitis capitata TaxID=7213 RepID=A0A811VBI8_CERCA|nr:unnamed protein product [Ceratitis capitata]
MCGNCSNENKKSQQQQQQQQQALGTVQRAQLVKIICPKERFRHIKALMWHNKNVETGGHV